MADDMSLATLLTPIIKRLPSYGKVAYAIYTKDGVTVKQKLLLGAGIAYAVSPIDLVPGFIPVIGQLDDIIVALYSLKKVLQQIHEQEREEILAMYGLSTEQLNEDIKTANLVSKKIALKGLKYSGKGLKFAGKTLLRLASTGGKLIYSKVRGKGAKKL